MKPRNWIILFLILIGLTACSEPAGINSSASFVLALQAWIDAPLKNDQLPLLPYLLIFHGAGVTGVDQFEVKVNQEVIAGVPASPSTAGGAAQDILFVGDSLPAIDCRIEPWEEIVVD